MFLRGLLYLFVILLVPVVFAAPEITFLGVDEFTQGVSVLIQGSSFGDIGPTVDLFADFEEGSDNLPLFDGAGSANFGQWSLATHGDVTNVYSDMTAVSGSLSARFDESGSGDNYLEKIFDSHTNEFFGSWWIYLPENDYYPGQPNNANWKTVWLMRTSETGSSQSRDLTLPTAIVPSGSDNPAWLIATNDGDNVGFTEYTNIGFQKGRWSRVSIYVKDGTTYSSNDGKFHLWYLNEDQAMTHEESFDNLNLLTDDDFDYWDRVHINGYAYRSDPSHPTFDDVYLAIGEGARARVEIGNAPVYEDCTAMTILRPTSWSDTSISAVVNVGPFDGSEELYLFVVDADGAVSDGYPVTISPSSGPIITSVSSALSDGATVSIEGLGFGVKSIDSSTYFEDFELGNPSDLLGSEGYWSLYSDNVDENLPMYSSNFSRAVRSPTNALFDLIWVSGQGGHDYIIKSGLDFSDGRVFLDYWLRFSYASSTAIHQIKLARVGASTSDAYVYPHFFTTHWINGNGNYVETRSCTLCSVEANVSYLYDAPPEDQWSHIQFAMDVGGTSEPGLFHIWQDGVYKGLKDGLDWTRDECDPLQQIWIGGYLGNAEQFLETEIYYDDVYFSNSWARIELGNDPVYEESTHRETQIPLSWSDSSLSFEANLGSFTQVDIDSGLYLFVVDENGSVSDGFPISVVSDPTPNITSVVGSFVVGATVSIEGSGFGIKDPVEPYLWDTLINQPPYETLSNGDVIPVRREGGSTFGTPGDCVDCPWHDQGFYNEPVTFNRINPRTQDGATYRVTPSGFMMDSDPGELEPTYIYVNWWIRTSEDIILPQGDKFIRIWQDGSITDIGTRTAWEFQQLLLNNENGSISPIPWGGIVGQFNNLELEIDSNYWGVDGHALTSGWVNGKQLFMDRETGHAPPLSGPFNHVFKIGLEQNIVDHNPEIVADWTDIYVDFSRAKVFVCDTSSWEEKLLLGAHCELQIPKDIWTENKVNVTVNLGGFDGSEPLYLFVVDEAGVASNGFGPLEVSSQTFLPGDLNHDGYINLDDLLQANTLSKLLLVGRNLFTP